MAYIEKEIKRCYWKLPEVAKELQCPESKIYYWLRYFQLRIRKSSDRSFMFTEQDRERIREIYFLSEVEGLKLWGIKRKLENL